MEFVHLIYFVFLFVCLCLRLSACLSVCFVLVPFVPFSCLSYLLLRVACWLLFVAVVYCCIVLYVGGIFRC